MQNCKCNLEERQKTTDAHPQALQPEPETHKIKHCLSIPSAKVPSTDLFVVVLLEHMGLSRRRSASCDSGANTSRGWCLLLGGLGFGIRGRGLRVYESSRQAYPKSLSTKTPMPIIGYMDP